MDWGRVTGSRVAPTARLSVAEADLSGREEEYVIQAIRSTRVSGSGPFVERFEREFADLCGTTAAIATCNGTVALHLALLALDLRPGDEVLVPDLTYVATANAVRYCGAEPVFVDVDPATWCIAPDSLEAHITRRTRGVIPVHLYGHPADMDAINHIAGVHGLWVVEDAAEAHMATYKGRPVGGLAQAATFSFYGNKIFTSGEGGAVTCDDPHLALRMQTLRGQGMDPERQYYFPVTGYNFRLTNVACAILCAQLERRQEILTKREALFDEYRRRLSGIDGVSLQPQASWAVPAPWLFSVTIDSQRFGQTRDSVARALAEAGVETRPFFIPLHLLPPFREAALARGVSYPVSEYLGAAGLNLPTHAGVRPDDVELIAGVVRELAGG